MANHYSNPTANTAIGAVDRELRIMRKRAQSLKRLRQQGKLTPQQEAVARRQFVGIYRRLLEEALGDTPGQNPPV